MFNVGMLLVGAMILVQGLRERSRGVEVGFALGVAAIAIIGFTRGISAAERSHLIEYPVLAKLARNYRLVERLGWELADAQAEALQAGRRTARRSKEFPYATLTSWSRRRRTQGASKVGM